MQFESIEIHLELEISYKFQFQKFHEISLKFQEAWSGGVEISVWVEASIRVHDQVNAMN